MPVRFLLVFRGFLLMVFNGLGIVATELQSHWTFQGAKDWLANAGKDIESLQPQDVAEVVGFLASQPGRVKLQQVTVMPTRQGV